MFKCPVNLFDISTCHNKSLYWGTPVRRLGMEVSEEAVMVDSSRLKSVVWKDFDRIKNGEKCVAVCRHCKKKLSGSSTSGTSHLRNHLIRCRRRSNHDITQLLSAKGKKKEAATLAIASISFDQEDQRALAGKNATTTTTTTCKFEQGHTKDVAINIRNNYYFDHKRSRFDLARMIILHNYPLTMVEHVGFKAFVRNLQPLFELVTVDELESDCMEIYQNEKQKVYALLDKLPGKISISADTWVAAKGDARYLCLTAHCIDETWQLKKKALNFISVEDDSSSPYDFSQIIMTCLREWDIDRKLFSMTFDNCCSPTYDYVACRIRDLLLQNRFLLCNGQLFEVGCAANVIKLMAQDALEALTDVTYKIRESIKYVTSSELTQRKFNEIVQQVMGESTSSSSSNKKCLCIDDPLRWNSTHIMLEVALEYKQAFSLLQQHEPLYTDMICLSDLDWERCCAVSSFLKLFVEVSNVFTGGSGKQQYPTANIYFPEICDIHLQLIEWCQNPDEYICSLASKMKIKFDEYWKKTSLVLAIAAILDPRFKMKLVEYYYPQIYGENATECIEIVSNCMKELYNGHDIYSPLSAAVDGSHCQVSSSNNNDRLMGFDRFLHETSQSQSIKSDLEKYLEEPLFPRNVDFSILNWWKVHTPRYPILSMMARNVLGIPMSKVGVDNSDKVVDHFRTALSPDTLQALMCAHNWLSSNGLEDSKLPSCPSTLALCYNAN